MMAAKSKNVVKRGKRKRGGAKKRRQSQRKSPVAGRKRSVAGQARKGRAVADDPLAWLRKTLFADLAKADGWGSLVVVVESVGGQWDGVAGAKTTVLIGKKNTTGRRWGRAVGGLRRLESLADVFLSLGHPQRLRILEKLLEGPAKYQALCKITGLKPGPLYHHINQMRLSGLIMPKERDLYELTRGGRNLILTALAAGGLASDRRRRPLGIE